MAEISAAVGAPDDAAHYAVRPSPPARSCAISAESSRPLQNISAVFAAQWQAQAVSSDGRHVLTSFGDVDSSSALSYNLFADKLLETNLIAPSVRRRVSQLVWVFG